MVKKLRPKRDAGQGVQDTAREEDAGDSQPPGAGGLQPYVNERGEVCIGTECFNLAVDADRQEVRVTINREECSDELQETLDQLHQVLGRGAHTVYETKSDPRR